MPSKKGGGRMRKSRPSVSEVLEVRRAQYVVEMEGTNETGRMQEGILKCPDALGKQN